MTTYILIYNIPCFCLMLFLLVMAIAGYFQEGESNISSNLFFTLFFIVLACSTIYALAWDTDLSGSRHSYLYQWTASFLGEMMNWGSDLARDADKTR